MFSKIIKLLFASSLIAALLKKNKKDDNDTISTPSDAFEKATTQTDLNRDFVEVPENNNPSQSSSQDESESFIQSPG
tara:strand:+ start:6049 stop:6279 length:231 start_codon:yes stop_codon:yes gene_type:complete